MNNEWRAIVVEGFAFDDADPLSGAGKAAERYRGQAAMGGAL